MNRWEAPRREGNQGERVTAGSRPARQSLGPGGRQRPGWLGLGARRRRCRGDLEPWVVAGRGAATGRIYVCLSLGQRSPVQSRLRGLGVEGGVAPCRAPTRYISPPNAMTHVKKPASSLAACVPPPGDAARGVASPRGRTGGLDASPRKGNLSMCSFNGGRRAEGRRLPGPSRPRGPSHRAFNGGDGA